MGDAMAESEENHRFPSKDYSLSTFLAMPPGFATSGKGSQLTYRA
jgi:hypothetical protein